MGRIGGFLQAHVIIAADGVAVSLEIDVVPDLESQPEGLAIAAGRLHLGFCRLHRLRSALACRHEKAGGLAEDDAQIIFGGGVGGESLLLLQHLPFRKIGKGTGELVKRPLNVGRVREEGDCAGEPEISYQHRRDGTETRHYRGDAAARHGLVGDIVVQEGGIVQDFDGSGVLDAFVRGRAAIADAGEEQRQHWTQHLAGIVEDGGIDFVEQGHVGTEGAAYEAAHPFPILAQQGYDRFPVHHKSFSSSAGVETKCSRLRSSGVSIPCSTKWSSSERRGS